MRYYELISEDDQLTGIDHDIALLKQQIEKTKAEKDPKHRNQFLKIYGERMKKLLQIKDNRSGERDIDRVLDPFVMTIRRDCQPFLAAIGRNVTKYHLARGMNDTDTSIILTRKIRLNDRKPVNTPAKIHNRANRYFTDKFGEPFRNALFASSNLLMSREYGYLYLIFPVGNFSYLWSPSVKDMYYLEDEMGDAMEEDEEFPEDDMFGELMAGFNYTDQDLKSGIESGNEIMIRCDKFHGIRVDDWFDAYVDDSGYDSTPADYILEQIQDRL